VRAIAVTKWRRWRTAATLVRGLRAPSPRGLRVALFSIMPTLTIRDACAPPTLREMYSELPDRPPRMLAAAVVMLLVIVFGGAAVVLGGGPATRTSAGELHGPR
jgi:hypothetical protein